MISTKKNVTTLHLICQTLYCVQQSHFLFHMYCLYWSEYEGWGCLEIFQGVFHPSQYHPLFLSSPCEFDISQESRVCRFYNVDQFFTCFLEYIYFCIVMDWSTVKHTCYWHFFYIHSIFVSHFYYNQSQQLLFLSRSGRIFYSL